VLATSTKLYISKLGLHKVQIWRLGLYTKFDWGVVSSEMVPK
jgi:hypothetical protein